MISGRHCEVMLRCPFLKEGCKQHPQRTAEEKDDRRDRGKKSENIFQPSGSKSGHDSEQRYDKGSDQHEERALFHTLATR